MTRRRAKPDPPAVSTPLAHIISCVDALLALAKAFLAYLEGFGSIETIKRAEHQTHKKELEAATVALRFANAFKSLDSLERGKLSAQLNTHTELLRYLFDSLIDRWEWNSIVGSDGETYLSELRRAEDEEERLYLRAISAYVQDPRGKRGLGVLFAAHRAMMMGINNPNMSFEEAESRIRSHGEAMNRPLIGGEWPTCHPEDIEGFEAYIKKIEHTEMTHPVQPPTTKETPKRLGRPPKTEFTFLENEVWRLYEKHRGGPSPHYEIAGILKPRFANLTHDDVQRIIRRIKARKDRVSRKPASRD